MSTTRNEQPGRSHAEVEWALSRAQNEVEKVLAGEVVALRLDWTGLAETVLELAHTHPKIRLEQVAPALLQQLEQQDTKHRALVAAARAHLVQSMTVRSAPPGHEVWEDFVDTEYALRTLVEQEPAT